MEAKILVVEDDNDIRRNLKRLFESEGYDVEVAENGQVALDVLLASATLPSVIILDLTMPVMDGFQFRDQQRATARIADIPVVVMTADGRFEEKRLKIQAQDAVRKPADVDEILRIVGKHCNK